jgi:hypothetical protein
MLHCQDVLNFKFNYWIIIGYIIGKYKSILRKRNDLAKNIFES